MSNFEEMLSKSVNRMAEKNEVSKIELLPHNQMLYEQIEEKIKEGYRSIFYSEGTGLGKSFIFMRLVQDYFEGMNILYIVPKISIWTNLTRYEEFKTLNANIEMRTFASFNTYNKSDCEFYDVVFVDECHHMLSDIQGNNVNRLCKDMNALGKFSFGFTATPYYQEQYVDEVCFDCSCFGLDVFEAVEAGILRKIKLAVAGIDLDSIPEEYKARYSITGTEPLLNRILKEHSDIQRWLAYFTSKDDLEYAYSDLRELFPNYKILKLYTGIEDEDDILNQFEKYDGRVILMSVSKLLEGVHLKNIGGVLLYRNTGELSTYMQMYGRLCDMKNNSTPLFLDVTNSIVKLTSISSFKSSRYNGQPRNFHIKDFMDVDSIDYWTVELSELLKYNKPWTEDENNIIREYYPTEGSSTADRLCNRSKNAVKCQANKLGVKFERDYEELANKIRLLTTTATTLIEIARECHIDKKTAKRIIEEYNIDFKYNSSIAWTDEEVGLIKDMLIEGKSDGDILNAVNMYNTSMGTGVTRGIQTLRSKVFDVMSKYDIPHRRTPTTTLNDNQSNNILKYIYTDKFIRPSIQQLSKILNLPIGVTHSRLRAALQSLNLYKDKKNYKCSICNREVGECCCKEYTGFTVDELNMFDCGPLFQYRGIYAQRKKDLAELLDIPDYTIDQVSSKVGGNPESIIDELFNKYPKLKERYPSTFTKII